MRGLCQMSAGQAFSSMSSGEEVKNMMRGNGPVSNFPKQDLLIGLSSGRDTMGGFGN
jgi:hypothetical protein